MKQRMNFSWSAFIAGIFLTAGGIYALTHPGSLLSGLIILYGILALFTGIEDILIYVRLSRFTGFGPLLSLISGILSVMCGIMLIANPDAGKWALLILFPIWFIARCIAGLTRTGLIRLIGDPLYYCFSLILNILGLVLGFVMIFSPALSFVTLRAICYMAAGYLILCGTEKLMEAFAGNRWLP